ncbi:MAG: MBG domain-containing protein, partial [Ancalomicrobiaceae bacterium]|nr:MBG domain-containing protein [Ancalomicrobiaceae bacterium]
AVNAGHYSIVAAGLTSNNYSITYQPGTLTINQASLTLTITPNAATKTYGDALAFAGTEFTASGLVSGDSVTSVTLASNGTVATAGVGSYDIAASNAVGTGLGNYTISYATLVGGLTVTPRSLTITANAVSKTYGAADPGLTYAVSGLVNSDPAATVTGSLTRAAGEDVGAYAIGRGSLAAGANYAIVYSGANLTINPATLTITANAVSKTYGAADPGLTYAVSGLVNSDPAATVTGSLTRAAGEDVGAYAIGQGSLAAGANYAIVYAGANLTINPATLTITANDASALYGSPMPLLTASYSGFVNGETEASLTQAPTVVSSVSTTAGVGTYIGALTASGAIDKNYLITYVAGTLTIDPTAATSAAGSGQSNYFADAQGRVTPNLAPTLSYSFQQASLTTTTAPAPTPTVNTTGDIPTFAVSPDAAPPSTQTTTTTTTVDATISFAPGTFAVLPSSGTPTGDANDQTAANGPQDSVCPAGVAATALASVPYSCNGPASSR